MTATICLALAIFFEAGIEPQAGQIAVGWSIVNASTTLHKHKVSVCHEVIYSGRYMAINDRVDENHQIQLPKSKKWKKVVRLAKQIIYKEVADPTSGATHFECTKWRSCKNPPWWATNMQYMGMLGTQKFYKELNRG